MPAEMKVTDEVVAKVRASYSLDRVNIGEIVDGTAFGDRLIRAILQEGLAAMLEPAAWQGIDTESGYKRSYEVEADFRHMKNKPWFRAKRTYTIKESK